MNQISIGSNSLVNSDFNNYTISITNDLQNLLNDQFRKRCLRNLIINENSLNNLNGDLVLSGFDNLKKITVKKNSLKNFNLLKICNNEELDTIEIENGSFGEGAFFNVKNVIIESNLIKIIIIYIFLIYNQSKLEIIHSIIQSVSVYQVILSNENY